MKASNQTHLKINNQKVILDYIIENGATSRAELSKQLCVSKPTISTNVSELLANNILLEEGFDSPAVGKKAILLTLNKNLKYILVCDLITEILNGKIIISICNLNHEEVLSEKIDVSIEISSTNLNYMLNNQIVNILKNNNISLEKISKIIISSPGIVNDNLLAIKDEFGNILDISDVCNVNFKGKVILKNDIKLATLFENYFGEGVHFKNFAFIWVGIALNSGLILNGELYNGPNFAAGEIGLLLTSSPISDKPCFLNEIASANGIMNNILKFKEIPKSSMLYEKALNKTLNFQDFLKCVSNGDPYSVSIAKLAGKKIGEAIYNLSLTLDLEAIILNGELCDLGTVFLSEIENILKLNLLNKIQLKVSSKKNPIILGGYKLGVDLTLNNLIK